MARLVKKIETAALILLTLFLQQCANQLPPGGGEVDRVPPVIDKIYPANGTTNFKGNYFTLEFSKYIDKSTLQNALFISPAVDGELNFDWTNTTVTVTFPGTLRKNTTYVVTVGTDVADYNNHNRMAQAFTFTFSTGPEIFKDEIDGKVYAEKPEGILIFAYIKGDSTIDPRVRKPDYISQTGNDGAYKLPGLAPGDYRLFAVKDQYRDLLYQPDQDEIGMAYKDITLTREDTLFSGLNFMLTKIDTVAPRLVSAVMTDKFHVLVSLSKDFDSSIVVTHNFIFRDSTANKTYKPLYAFKGNTTSSEMVLVTGTPFAEKDDIFLIADTLKDIFGNSFVNDTVQVTVSEKPDTSKPDIFKTIPRNNAIDADFAGQRFSFYFNDGFDTSSARKAVTFTDTSKHKVPFAISLPDNGTIVVKPDKDLNANSDYIISIDMRKLKDAAGNSLDSVYQYKFKTINGLDFTGLTGKAESVDFSLNPYLVLQGADGEKPVYRKSLDENKNIKFERIQPGKYLLWGFYDTDSSKTYTYGKPFPFRPAERFYFYPDTLTLRPRWTQTGIIFNFK